MRVVGFIRLYGEHFPVAMKMIFDPRCRITLIDGITRREKMPVKVLYIGRYYNGEYIEKAIFDRFETVIEKRTTLFSARRHAEKLRAQADLLLCDIGWPYHGLINRNGSFLELPDWVNMSIFLEETWEETKQLFHKTIRRQDLRYIRIEGYRSETTSDPKEVADFYDRMYLPFMRSKHGGSMVKARKGHFVRRGRKGALLKILKDDKMLAGGIVFEEDDALFFLWIGLAPECFEHPPRALISAVYYFGIQYAQEMGCEVVDFTGTRAFMGDGTFRFKRKWGAGLSDTFSPSSILFKPENGNETAARFCQEFPMLARRRNGPEWLFLSLDQPVDEKRLKSYYKEFECDGISRLSVIDASGQAADLSAVDLESLNARVAVASLKNFADHYRKNAP
ncbi:hypothetical protein [Pontiella agarivorans]|uniref:BioF2-like acetyltransferase domain-containing protein n=1 Tax=Pontiella agarivorans TaxID=3038953 RepID=A0ABU5MWD3_9BACT|nr:hypothetical protein [Pontiella agarivorans]MDZ8118525.1 hypothetical protein [Pontiella agarivorans]